MIVVNSLTHPTQVGCGAQFGNKPLRHLTHLKQSEKGKVIYRGTYA